jgi:hypothetical protein
MFAMANLRLAQVAKVSLGHGLPVAARGKVCRKLALAPDNAEGAPAKLAFMTRADAGCVAFGCCIFLLPAVSAGTIRP